MRSIKDHLDRGTRSYFLHHPQQAVASRYTKSFVTPHRRFGGSTEIVFWDLSSESHAKQKQTHSA